MLQSTFHAAIPSLSEPPPAVLERPVGLHVGIIMDGNGRWAVRRGLPRSAGHRAGAPAVRRTVASAPDQGIAVLTLFAFSSDNWRRPPREVGNLMRLFALYLRSEADRCEADGVRVGVIGRRDRLPRSLVAEIETIEARTRQGTTLHLRLAVDYSSRGAIVAAVLGAAAHAIRKDGKTSCGDDLGAIMAGGTPGVEPIPDVDLVIRTGGEQRLSDFLLWESAYAELVFSNCLWPDFSESHLAAAIEQFHGRERRFGALPLTCAG